MAERVLSRTELNRALLARQLLLERAKLTIPRVLEQTAGLQAQYAPSMYVGLWSRMEGFERPALDRALERKSVVQGTLMRVTIHLVSARDYWPFAIALRESRRQWSLRVHRPRLDARTAAAAGRRLKRTLAGGTRSRAEIAELLARDAGLWLDLVRVPPSGTWARRRADLYAAAEDWLGPPAVTEDAAQEHLVRRYLRGFGPAARDEIASWAGLDLGTVDAVLDRLRLRRFRAEDGAVLVDLPRAPLPEPETPAPVRFLPTWDATLLVHARRTGILPEEHRARIFDTKSPQSFATFLVDGVVAGTWRWDGERIVLEPFGRLGRATRRELDEEARRLAELHG